jgi:hypothetical protein
VENLRLQRTASSEPHLPERQTTPEPTRADDGVQTWPAMALSQPVNVVNDGRRSGLDTAVIGKIVAARLIVVSAKALAFCSAMNRSTSSRKEP